MRPFSTEIQSVYLPAAVSLIILPNRPAETGTCLMNKHEQGPLNINESTCTNMRGGYCEHERMQTD